MSIEHGRLIQSSYKITLFQNVGRGTIIYNNIYHTFNINATIYTRKSRIHYDHRTDSLRDKNIFQSPILNLFGVSGYNAVSMYHGL